MALIQKILESIHDFLVDRSARNIHVIQIRIVFCRYMDISW